MVALNAMSSLLLLGDSELAKAIEPPIDWQALPEQETFERRKRTLLITMFPYMAAITPPIAVLNFPDADTLAMRTQ